MRKLQVLHLFLFLILLGNCQKEERLTPEEKQEQSAFTAMDYAFAHRVFNTVVNIVDEQAKQQPQLSGLSANGPDTVVRNGCMQVIFTPASSQAVFPATLTIEFGDQCTLPDGRSVGGQLKAVFTEELLQQDMQITITYKDFYLDGHGVQGQQVVINDGFNENGQFRYNVITIDGLITKPNQSTIEYRGSTWRDWVEGAGTNFFKDGLTGVQDDVWEIVGYAEGFNSQNISFKVQINLDQPIRWSMACPWTINGEVEVKTGDLALKSRLNYGLVEEEPTCDNLVTLTAGNHVEEIEL